MSNQEIAPLENVLCASSIVGSKIFSSRSFEWNSTCDWRYVLSYMLSIETTNSLPACSNGICQMVQKSFHRLIQIYVLQEEEMLKFSTVHVLRFIDDSYQRSTLYGQKLVTFFDIYIYTFRWVTLMGFLGAFLSFCTPWKIVSVLAPCGLWIVLYIPYTYYVFLYTRKRYWCREKVTKKKVQIFTEGGRRRMRFDSLR